MVKINPTGGLLTEEEVESRKSVNSFYSQTDIFFVRCINKTFKIKKSDTFPLGSIKGFLDEEDIRERLFYPYINQKTVLFDVGANFGTYSLRALVLGANRVIAFEPDPRGVITLRDSIGLNQGFKERVDIHEIALANQNMMINFADLEDVPVKKMDDFILERPNYIKIDVEGMEWLVIQGGMEIIKKYKPKILIENHLRVSNGVMMRKIVQTLTKEFGYDVDIIPSTEPIVFSFFK